MLRFTADELRRVSEAIFKAVGTPSDVAPYMAETLVECDLMGHESHGVIRIPSYVERVEAGLCAPAARPTIVNETPTTAVVSGHWTFGQVAARFAAELVIRKAKESNIAAVSVVECNHQGRLGEYSTMIARERMIGMVVTGGFGKPFNQVAPYGGAKGILGTNPFSFAVPAGAREPFVADFATSVVAEGKLRVAQAKGVSVPEGWVIDAEGRPSTDPSAYQKGGAMLAFGGHKGYALSLLADLLGSFLGGAEKLGTPPLTYGTFMMALRVDAFRPFEEFTSSVDRRFGEIKDVPPAEGFEEVLVPGEPESRTKAQRVREGIPVPEATWEKITAIAAKYNLDVDGLLAG
jgi:LDH2 family malate/lactate/ureidoglycolate dehydrogenase